jgi:hypothetical protein
MSKSPPSTPNRSVWSISIGAVFLSAAILIALAVRPATTLAHEKAGQLYQLSQKTSDSGSRQASLQAAHLLDRSNDKYSNSLIDVQLQRGQIEAALQTAKAIPGEDGRVKIAALQFRLQRFKDVINTLSVSSSDNAKVLKSKAWLEIGDSAQAASIADGKSEGVIAQKALALSMAGETGEVSNLIPTVSSPEAQETLKKAYVGHLALAQELYVRGLLNASERVAAKEPDSLLKFRLLTAISLGKLPTNQKNATEALSYANKGLAISPSDLRLHELARDAARRSKDNQRLSKEEKFISNLENGKI